MPVLMTFRIKADPNKLEQFAASESERFRSVAEAAKQRGLIAHRFFGSDDGHVLVADVWPDAESWQSFFEENRDEIEPMMRESGAQGEPEVTFWRELETNDKVGWDA